MNRFKLIIAEAVRSLGANMSTTFAAVTTVLIGMFMLGLVVGFGSWALSLSNHYKSQLLVKVDFCTPLSAYREALNKVQVICPKEATPAQMNAVRAKLAAIPQVKELKFVSKEDALRIEKRDHPEYTQNLTGNPLPNEFQVIPKHAEDVDAIAAQLSPLPAGVESTCPPAPGTSAAADVEREELQPHHAPRGLGRALPLDRRADRVHRPAHLLDAARREHDQALDLRPSTRDRGDEARRRDELVRAGPVHDRRAPLPGSEVRSPR